MSNMSEKQKSTANYHLTDLSSYASDRKTFEEYLRKNVRTKEDVERLLNDFDDEQKRRWKK